MWFDPHWHARDEEQSHKDTIARSLKLAEAAGASAIAVMPNVARPLINLERCREYLGIADLASSSVQFYVHIGLTPDLEQVKRAVEACRIEPKIIGMKAYFGRSTGDLSIVHEEDQHRVLETLAREGYEGVLVGHCEKEALMHDDLYDRSNPVTWSTLSRPEAAEIASFEDIAKIAEDVRFEGTIHVAHVSTTEVVDKINSYNGFPFRMSFPLNFSCGVTPHHLFLDNTRLSGAQGAWYKCNPPLRDKTTQEGLLERFLDGRISILESDHAPHTEEDKHTRIPASGIISGPVWPYVIQKLDQLGMSLENIFRATFDNARQLYGLSLEPRKESVQWDKLEEIRSLYPFDPFKGVF